MGASVSSINLDLEMVIFGLNAVTMTFIFLKIERDF